jgi:nucleoside-diphosphate-sugar epimerase
MRVLVAGAAGAVGRRLVPALVAAGHEVAGTTRSQEGAGRVRALGARPIAVDAFDREGLRRALRAERPDAVIHQLTDLARLDLEANARLRIEGTRNLVHAARGAGVRRMVAQSIAFAYGPGRGPAGEHEPLDVGAPPPRRRTVEGVMALEGAVAEMDEGVVLRYGALYGPGTFYAPGGMVAERIRKGELPATGGVTSFLHVDDAAEAALLALGWPAGTVNVVDDEPAAGTAWIPVLASLLGGPTPPAGGPGAPTERGASNARARGELGWRPIHASWREGFARALGDAAAR